MTMSKSEMAMKWAAECRRSAEMHRKRAEADPVLAREHMKRANAADERAARYEAEAKNTVLVA